MRHRRSRGRYEVARSPLPRARLFWLLAAVVIVAGCSSNRGFTPLGMAGTIVDGTVLTGRALWRGAGLVATATSSLFRQSGYLFSELFGDPADRAEDYRELALVEGCANAVSAIEQAAEATRISANYLLALARQESGCRSHARNPNSSAVGMFQFVEATWLVSYRNHGADYDDPSLARAIEINRSGEPVVRSGELRQRILDRRLDAQLSAYLAAELALDNARFLRAQRHRSLRPTDLYMAHFLGAPGAARFLDQLERGPSLEADRLLPRAARANPAVFYRNGQRNRPRSVADVYAFFAARIEGA